MDVEVDQKAKYALMCRQTVPTSEKDKESTYLGLWEHFHLQLRYFQRTEQTTMHKPFNICNLYSLFKFIPNFANCLRSWTIE